MEYYKNPSLENLTCEYEGIVYTEKWKDMKDWEGQYQISDFGRVKSLKRTVKRNQSCGTYSVKGKILRTHIINTYPMFSIKGTMYMVHLVVWDHFSTEKRNGYELMVDHINEDKADCRFINLQLLTQRNNTIKSFIYGGKIYTGVFKKRNKYGSKIMVKGKVTYLGVFNNEQLAHNAYLKKKISMGL